MNEDLKWIEAAARAAHEVNRAYCIALGDDSQLSWDDAPAWQRDSVLAGVRAIVAQPTLTAAQSHSLWAALKRSEGWEHGETKDVERKTHPCLVPYDELPPEQKRKDELFGITARLLLGLISEVRVKEKFDSVEPAEEDHRGHA